MRTGATGAGAPHAGRAACVVRSSATSVPGSGCCSSASPVTVTDTGSPRAVAAVPPDATVCANVSASPEGASEPRVQDHVGPRSQLVGAGGQRAPGGDRLAVPRVADREVEQPAERGRLTLVAVARGHHVVLRGVEAGGADDHAVAHDRDPRPVRGDRERDERLRVGTGLDVAAGRHVTAGRERRGVRGDPGDDAVVHRVRRRGIDQRPARAVGERGVADGQDHGRDGRASASASGLGCCVVTEGDGVIAGGAGFRSGSSANAVPATRTTAAAAPPIVTAARVRRRVRACAAIRATGSGARPGAVAALGVVLQLAQGRLEVAVHRRAPFAIVVTSSVVRPGCGPRSGSSLWRASDR